MRSKHVKIIAAVVVLVLVVVGARSLPLDAWLQSARSTFDAMGPSALVVYAGIYAVATVLMLPGSVFTLGAGAIFGAGKGILVVFVGANLGAALSFLAARKGLRGLVERRLAGNDVVTSVDKAVAAEGWKAVLLTRLSPVFPFVLLNYAYGLTGVGFGGYLAGTLIGMIPGIVLYTLIGASGAEGAAALSRGGVDATLVLQIAGIVATVVVSALITRRARAELRRIRDDSAPT